MSQYEQEIDALRSTISEAVARKCKISTTNGSVILVNQDEHTGQYYAALAVAIEYSTSPESAVAALREHFRRMIDVEGTAEKAPHNRSG